MTIRHRRIVYLSFIGLFLILAPILILYTAGYRYNIKKHKLQKTGVLILKYQPRDAEILINNLPSDTNGRFQEEARITNLFPGNYEIKVKKENHYPWEKKLDIYSNLTTFAQHIILFKKSTPVQIAKGEMNVLVMDPNKESLAYTKLQKNNESLYLLNLKTREETILLQERGTSPKITDISWSADGKRLLAAIQRTSWIDYQVIDISQKQPEKISLWELTKKAPKNVEWDPRNGVILYGYDNNDFFRIDLFAQKTTKLLAYREFSDYLIDNEKIYLVENDYNKQTFLKIYKTNYPKEEPGVIKLPYSPEYGFASDQSKFITLLDKKNQILYLIDQKADTFSPIQEVISGVKYAEWSEKHNRLLWANDLEIWVYDFELNQKELLTRLSQNINETIWHPSFDYVAFVVDNTLKIIEKDGRDKRNLVDFVKMNKMNNIMVDKKAQKLYFWARAGQQAGLYELEI